MTIKIISPQEYVGFDSLPYQIVNKHVKAGFTFNIMCIGETGIGKSTMMNTLFNTDFSVEPAQHRKEKVTLHSEQKSLKEGNVLLNLTVIDSVGFGDQLDNSESYKPIVEYINEQFELYLDEELKIDRRMDSVRDTRVHVCLYFISPSYTYGLKALDLLTMKQIDSKVNIIPIIAKADTVTRSELTKIRQKIMNEIVSEGIQIYEFPTNDDLVAEKNVETNSMMPLAIVGSNEEIKIANRSVRGRQYPWGIVQVENENHCDFVRLRDSLIRSNLEDLMDTTHNKHYELFRRCRLKEMGFEDSSSDNKLGNREAYLTTYTKCTKYTFGVNPGASQRQLLFARSYSSSFSETLEQKKLQYEKEMMDRESEMKELFAQKVKKKEAEIKEKENEFKERYEQLKAQMQSERETLEEKRRKLDEEIAGFEKIKATTQQEMNASTLKRQGRR